MNKNLMEKSMSLIITAILIVGAFTLGSLYTKVQMLEKGIGSANIQAKKVGTANNQLAKTTPSKQVATTGLASTDDDPFIGDKDAPITIIEFSDYECPFCKKFFTETLPKLKEKYIDTGKVKMVYRDLPLSFHEPMASKEAIAANCAREQGGDEQYFKYHDQIFERTISNGNGLNDQDIQTIAADLNLDIDSFNTCLKDPKQSEEVKKDVADASKAGATGTPSFIIGRSTSDGDIQGDKIVGAQPFAAFEAILSTIEQ